MYSSEIVKSGSFSVPNMQLTSKANITVGAGTNFKVTIGNICGEDINVNIFTVGQTFTLEANTTYTHVVEKEINCGKVKIETVFSAGSGCITYTMRKIHDFSKSFVTTAVSGAVDFSGVVMGQYTWAYGNIDNATLYVKRNGLTLAEGTVLYEGENIVVSASPNEYYVVDSIVVNNVTYPSGSTVKVSSTMSVNGVITIGVNVRAYEWVTLYSGSTKLSNNGTLQISGLKSSERTRFTTSAVTVEYTIGDICGNYSDTVTNTFSANTNTIANNGTISSGSDDGVATYGYTLKAQSGNVKFTANATMNTYDEWTDLYLSDAYVYINKVEQMREPQ